jgi:hypothetical protein
MRGTELSLAVEEGILKNNPSNRQALRKTRVLFFTKLLALSPNSPSVTYRIEWQTSEADPIMIELRP